MQLGLPAAAAAAADAYRVAWRDTSPLKFVAVLSRFISWRLYLHVDNVQISLGQVFRVQCALFECIADSETPRRIPYVLQQH